MLINSICETMIKNSNNSTSSKVTFEGKKYAYKSDVEVRKILVDKYINSEKLDSNLKKQISDELLVEKFQWETPTKPDGEKDSETKRTERALSIISVGMYNLMNALKHGSEKEEANDMADQVLTILSYLTGKEIEKEETPDYTSQYSSTDDNPLSANNLYVP